MPYPVILSGGVGSRLWPVSRDTHPKPFIRLADGETLLHKAYQRAISLKGVTNILTVTSYDLLSQTCETYNAFADRVCHNRFICEPVRRNTAPAILMATLHAAQTQGGNTVLLVLPADHLIADQNGFELAVAEATQLAEQGRIVTFGIKPTHPETAYGYIETDGNKVCRFVEKPPLDLAQRFIADGRYLWNAGIFCFKASTMLDAFSLYAPDFLESAMDCYRDAMFQKEHSSLNLSAEMFSALPNISIDYAIMEKSEKISVVPCDMGWTDIGSWRAMEQTISADQNGNRVSGDAILHNTSNCYIESPHRVAGVADVNDLVIVDTPDAFLVAKKDSTQGIQAIFHQHRERTQPWGTTTVLEDHKIRRIQKYEIFVGQSLPQHIQAGNPVHWIVVAGQVHFSSGSQDMILAQNKTILTDARQNYHFKNSGDEPTVLIAIENKTGALQK